MAQAEKKTPSKTSLQPSHNTASGIIGSTIGPSDKVLLSYFHKVTSGDLVEDINQ
jgi:hypothetical protein